MNLTNAILISNGFVLNSDGNYNKIVGGDSVSFDEYFHILYNNNAYPMCYTVADANARFVALAIAIVLV